MNSLLRFFAFSMLLASCSVERKVANRLSTDTDGLAVMLISTDQIYSDQMTFPEVEGWEDLSVEQQDSIRLSSSRVVKDLSAQQYLNIFRQSYTKELIRYGIKIFSDSDLAAFQSWEGNAWLVNLAQIEVLEQQEIVRDEELVNGTLYTYDLQINTVNIASWFEVARINAASDNSMEVLFASYDLTDDYHGYFTQNFVTGEVGYNLQTDTLNIEKFYNAVAFLGRLYAGYTFDYILNIRLNEQVENDKRSGRYFRYDPYRRFLFSTDRDRFVPLTED